MGAAGAASESFEVVSPCLVIWQSHPACSDPAGGVPARWSRLSWRAPLGRESLERRPVDDGFMVQFRVRREAQNVLKVSGGILPPS